MAEESIAILRRIIEDSANIVFFGGAGVSTESGIPDFRSAGGLYQGPSELAPETILSHSFYRSHPEEFFRFHRAKMIRSGAKPNAAHKKLSELEQLGKLRAIVTQNIDGLHQAAGSKHVLELHGSVARNYCEDCQARYDLRYITGSTGIPRCKTCGGIVRPDVVLYEEGLDQKILKEAIRCISEAEVLIVGGTSLVVYPAAGLIDYFKGKKLVIVNQSTTPRDDLADLVITAPIGEVFEAL